MSRRAMHTSLDTSVCCTRELEQIESSPIEWADEDGSRATRTFSTRDHSFLSFPAKSRGCEQGVLQADLKDADDYDDRYISYHRADFLGKHHAGRRKRQEAAARFNSLPTRGPDKKRTALDSLGGYRCYTSKLQAHTAHDDSLVQRQRLEGESNQPSMASAASAQSSTSASSSSSSQTLADAPLSPRTSDARLQDSKKMSMPRRSFRSLRYLASTWSSYAASASATASAGWTGRSRQQSSEQESVFGAGPLAVKSCENGRLDHQHRPARLDKRRLDKAVSLAVEAAQAAEEDERLYRRRLLQNSGASSAPTSGPNSPSLGGRLALPSSRENALNGARRPPLLRAASGEQSMNTQLLLRHGQDMVDLEDEDADGFAIDLYISSLGYLLSALRPEDAAALPAAQREQLSSRLRQALDQVKDEQRPSGSVMSQEEEFVMWRVKRNLALLDVEQHMDFGRRIRTGFESTEQPSPPPIRSETNFRNVAGPRSLAGNVAMSALDLGLSLGAGLVAAACKGIESLIPTLDAKTNTHKDIIEELEPSLDPKGRDLTQAASSTLLTGAQWDLTKTLASSVASTIYTQLATAGRGQSFKEEEVASRALTRQTSQGNHADTENPEDRLMLLTASIARSVKRSPLPNQVKVLSTRIIALAAAIDRRYSLSKRSTDVALRKTGEALSYARRNDLHVKAVRMAWNVVEASVVAVEAYRNEEGWHEHDKGQLDSEKHRPALLTRTTSQ